MTSVYLFSTVLYFVTFCQHWCYDVASAVTEARPRVAQFASLEVFEGQSIELPCTVSAIASLSVCWHVASDQAVASGSRYVAFCQDPDRLSEHDRRHALNIDQNRGKYNLHINRVFKEDTGIYMCAIINDEGIAVLFGSGRLSVVKPTPPALPPTCQFLARDVLQEGEMVSATCFAASGATPLPTLQWVDNYNEITMSQKTIANANQLNFQVSAKDAGAVYKCLEHHIALESPRNCTIGPLNVLYRPKLHLNSKPHKPKIGHNVTLTCRADSNPELTNQIQWYIEGVSIYKQNPKLEYKVIDDVHNISQLILYQIKEKIFNSTITCSAQNGQGQHNVSVVYEPPKNKSHRRTHATLQMVLILDLVALSMIVFFSVCVLGCWNSWRTISYRIRGQCMGRAPFSEPHHVPL